MLGLQDRIANIGTIDQDVIATGSLVRLHGFSEADEWEVLIVSSAEADPEADRISNECPIGEALLGRRPGDTIFVEVPSGTVQYRVLSVSRSISQ